MTPPRGLLGTSVFIASETGRPLIEDRIPAEVAASVVTLAELQAGVLAAPDTDTRVRRLATLDALSDLEVLPVDEDAAGPGPSCASTWPRPVAGCGSTTYGSPRWQPHAGCRS